MKSLNRFICICLTLITFSGSAQSLQEAIKQALAQNYSVLISRNTVSISENNATRGQAGLLPTVSANAGVDYGNDNIQIQVLGSPTVNETKNAESQTYTASLKAQYTVYAGGANKRTYEKLLINADLSDAQSRVQVESVIMQVISAYYNIRRAADNMGALEQSLELSEKRLRLANNRYELSGGSKVNVLNARVDRNKDSVALLNAQQVLKEAEIGFNQLLNRPLETPVNLANEELMGFTANYDSLKAVSLKQNWDMQAARLNVQVSMLDYKIARAAYMPQLNLSTSYDYQRSESEGSFLQYNQSAGFGAALTLSIPIYSGGVRSTAVNNAQIRIMNSEMEVKNRELALEADLLKAYRDYERAVRIVRMESSNLELAEENFEYTERQFAQGQVSSTQLREAQVNLLLIRNNLNNETFNLRLAELELMRLSGALVQDI